MSFCEIKVKNGKLLQLELKDNQYFITGDFFCYPGTVIDTLENILNSNSSTKLTEIRSLLKVNSVIGFGYKDLWYLYLKLNKNE